MAFTAESLPKAIQLSVSPVFLLAGIGAMMNVLSGRLVRCIDRARTLKESGERLSDSESIEYGLLKKRMQLATRSIELLASSTLAIATVVAMIFLSVILELNLSQVVAPLFVAAMLMLMVSTINFLREIRLASRQLKDSLSIQAQSVQ